MSILQSFTGGTDGNVGKGVTRALSVPTIVGMALGLLGRRVVGRNTGPVTARPTELRQIDQAVTVAKAQDRDAVLAAGAKALANQQAHPDIFYYTRTRIYLADYTDTDGSTDPDKFLMTFFDEFDNYPAYFAALLSAPVKQPAVVRLGRDMLKYGLTSDPRGHRTHTTWTEQQDMRVSVADRKVLYPANGTGKAPTDDVIAAGQHAVVTRKTDTAPALAAIGARLAYERDHPDRFYFTRARVFTAPHPAERTQEVLMVLYEADDRDKYLASFAQPAETDTDYRALTDAVDRYVLDDPETRVTVWTERQELRVQYESREPLYPSPGDDDTSAAPTMLGRLGLGIANVVAAAQTRDPHRITDSVTTEMRRAVGIG